MIWTRPKQFGPVQNHFGPIEGQGITHFMTPPAFCTSFRKNNEIGFCKKEKSRGQNDAYVKNDLINLRK